MEVYFDGECGMCRRLMHWYMAQPLEIEPHFIPYQKALVDVAFPELEGYDPQEQMVLRINRLEVLYGADAVLALIQLSKRYHRIGRLMSHPSMLAMARSGYRWVARNRHKISHILFGPAAQCQLPDPAKEKGGKR